MRERVVVAGLGIVTPLGVGIKTNWVNLNSPDRHPRRPLAGDPWIPRQSPRGMTNEGLSRAHDLAHVATSQALADAGLWDGQVLQDVDPKKFGCTLSASKPLMQGEKILPPDVINRSVTHRFGFQGESRNVIAACATGAYAIALGASWIEQGLCDIVLAGSVEGPVHPLIEAGFEQMGVLTREAVMRPFDRKRSGFVIGSGAGAVVLESESHAARRGVRVYARLSGWGLGSDSHSAVAFNSGGAHIAQVIRKALVRAELSPSHIGHINAHGTATRLNDWIETQSLLAAFGPHAENLHISATKSSTGHLLGAAGSVEFILTVLALYHQRVPPTRHLEEEDPQCPLDFTPREGRAARFSHAMSLSFGFGGPIGVLALSR